MQRDQLLQKIDVFYYIRQVNELELHLPLHTLLFPLWIDVQLLELLSFQLNIVLGHGLDPVEFDGVAMLEVLWAGWGLDELLKEGVEVVHLFTD